jgi:glycosyltransferase involved in cell wall biosynthesis
MNTPGEINCAVLIASYNGADFIVEQLESIRTQNLPGLKAYISDDGSVDRTYQLIEENTALWRNDSLHLFSGPQTGFCNNFMSLINTPDIEADFFAFADQDDIWEVDKLSTALSKLKKVAADIPALYCSRSRLIDIAGKKIGFSPLFKKKPSFQNAMVQCIAGGNTMVMNKAARNLLMQTKGALIASHDWWSYLLIAGAGGVVFYSSYPSTLYRQHHSNVYGRNNNWVGRWHRMRLLFQGLFSHWNTINCLALQQYSHLLTPQNQQILDIFCMARNQWLLPRLLGVWRSGVYRQTLLGNLGLFVAVLFNRI